jgi:sugar O-acyltransferase (sialic acid O-acetyltransferase NeuD family)
LVRTLGHEVIGYADDDPAKLGMAVDSTGSKVIMSLQSILDHASAGDALPAGMEAIALAVGDNARRVELFDALRPFCANALIHPSVAVSKTACIDAGTVVFAHATINAGARVGRAVIINSGAIVEHDCTVGDGVHVSPGAILCGTVTVGARSWIGAGATVIHCMTVGCDALVGAGAVVVQPVPDNVVVVGNPARVQRAAIKTQ